MQLRYSRLKFTPHTHGKSSYYLTKKVDGFFTYYLRPSPSCPLPPV
jgi:hypothetical protein